MKDITNVLKIMELKRLIKEIRSSQSGHLPIGEKIPYAPLKVRH
jgi:hypothetical protein